MRALAAILLLTLVSCRPEPAGEAPGGQRSSTGSERLAALGSLAAKKYTRLEIAGQMIQNGGAGDSSAPEVHFTAEYAPEASTLRYELHGAGGEVERFDVDADGVTFSRSGVEQQTVSREAVMPNGKDWPYASRMAAPFLDSIDGYSATLNSFTVAPASAPAEVAGGDQLEWFQLEIDKGRAHDLMLFEFSKVDQLLIGIDPQDGLMRSLFTRANKPDQAVSEIRLTSGW